METKNVSGGIGFPGALALLFIGLKLTGSITWPWLWVLAPLWLPLAVVLGVFAVALGVVAIVYVGIFLVRALVYGWTRIVRAVTRKVKKVRS